jgi:hypothetical protein
MTDAEFWETERRLWLGGADVFRRWVAAECLMVFPDPTGIMDGPAVVEGIGPGPRWERVDFGEATLRRAGSEAPSTGRSAARATSGKPAPGGSSSTSRRRSEARGDR